jgi:hypothetical protein
MPVSKKAKSKTAKRQWKHVEESMKERGASPGAAVRAANSVVKKRAAKKKSK